LRRVEGAARPLELILARNLLASLSTPAFLIDVQGEIAFYNDAAGALLGRRYEDRGPMPAEEWTRTFGPLDERGEPRHFTDLPLAAALRRNRPAHERFPIRPLDGPEREIEASGLPILGAGGYRGAIIFFWPVEPDGAEDAP
jgi:PAS domain-containing protein